MIRTKSCIIDKFNFDPRLKRSKTYLKIYANKSECGKSSEPTAKTASSLNINDSGLYKYEPNVNSSQEQTNEKFRVNSIDQNKRQVMPKPDLSLCNSSLSETRIKSMVHILKNSNKFGSNNDLVVFLNSKLNEGYILLKTAFEYIDPDHFEHLLLDEFRIVLEEFNIRMDVKICKSLLKKYNFNKYNITFM